MKNNFKWHKELINGKWYSVCDHEHVPMIEHCKGGKYKVRNANGKAILHEDYTEEHQGLYIFRPLHWEKQNSFGKNEGF